MIRVSCSKLEDVRKSPLAFAQQLLSDKKSGQGSYGMFQCWQSKAKALHTNEMDLPESIKSLQQRFMSYAENAPNKKKQEFLLDRLKPYWEEYQSKGFKYLGSQKQIFWKMIADVALTGHTPVSVIDGNGFAAYFFTEYPVSWQEQLKFPLLQYYLANNYFKCDLDRVKIGVYCLSTLKFDLKTYSTVELEDSISEAKGIFTAISTYYNKS